MSNLKFSDGSTINTDGELRKLILHDGMYLVGKGYLVPVKDNEEYEKILKMLSQ